MRYCTVFTLANQSDAQVAMLGNQFLDRIAQFGPRNFADRLEARDFAAGDLLAQPGTPIQRLVFPRSGLISLVVETSEGDQIEAGIIGRRGMLGGEAVFGAGHHIHTAVAQFSGRAWTLSIEDAKEWAAAPDFRALLFAQQRYLLAQAQQTAACNAKHSISQRLCSWLLRVHDEIGNGELLITQEMLAKMIGVQRASVSMFASQLQENGLVQYRRGRLQIIDTDGLEARACECHKAVREQFDRLFGTANVAVQIPPASGETTAPRE
jgi:CRP-like cAMP-binding protein